MSNLEKSLIKVLAMIKVVEASLGSQEMIDDGYDAAEVLINECLSGAQKMAMLELHNVLKNGTRDEELRA